MFILYLFEILRSNSVTNYSPLIVWTSVSFFLIAVDLVIMSTYFVCFPPYFCRQILLGSEILVLLGILLSFNLTSTYTVPQYVSSAVITFVAAEVLEGKF